MSLRSTARPRRAISGVLLLDKPAGITSQSAVTRAKNLYSAAKAGHTGTLDPMATGLLPLAFGEATKFSNALLDADKTYGAIVRLGMTTTTGDLEGAMVSRASVNVSRVEVEAVLDRFRGDVMQMPPMYSALKHAGKPLYVYARAGTEIARAPRQITISALELESYDGTELTITVTCSKGTYIRVLAEDIGKALGCGATLAALRRTKVGHYGVEDASTLEALGELCEEERMARLLPVDALLVGLQCCALDADRASQVVRGQTVGCPEGLTPGLTRLYGPDQAFLGLAEVVDERWLRPRRLLASEAVKA
ncbi:MAG TPA: tRNA pseudouridine(55) synthase TruB [Burkholderiales bacterium]|nr:tRNA pseudouridine(55) synthase TruB [Burkholderiales bacterium]